MNGPHCCKNTRSTLIGVGTDEKNDHPDGVLGFSALSKIILAVAHRDYTFPACRSHYVRDTGSRPFYLHCFLVHLSPTPSQGM